MATILNPIIPGMAPDPSILRVGDDYYIVTSTFHWQPAVQVFHSTDFVNWELLTYLLKDGEVNLQGTNTPAGIWAPHLSYDTAAKKFWLIYSHMQNMAGREFNAEAYAMSADDIRRRAISPSPKPTSRTAASKAGGTASRRTSRRAAASKRRSSIITVTIITSSRPLAAQAMATASKSAAPRRFSARTSPIRRASRSSHRRHAISFRSAIRTPAISKCITRNPRCRRPATARSSRRRTASGTSRTSCRARLMARC